VRSQGRPSQSARWEEIMGQDRIRLGGDWIAHSDRWDQMCPPKRDEAFLDNLINKYNLVDVTDGEETHINIRNGETLGLLIDFFTIKTSMVGGFETTTDFATTSDNAIVCSQSRWDEGKGAEVLGKITGWDIDGLKEEEKIYKNVKKQWEEKSLKRLILHEESNGEDLQEEAEWVQRNFVNHLNRHCKKIRVCARSKRWWTKEIAENRNILAFIKRSRKRGEATQRQVKK